VVLLWLCSGTQLSKRSALHQFLPVVQHQTAAQNIQKRLSSGRVGGGVKVVEKRRFENPAVISLERKSFGEV